MTKHLHHLQELQHTSIYKVQTIFLKKQALAAQTQNLTPHFGKLSPYQLLIVLFKVSEKKNGVTKTASIMVAKESLFLIYV
jgi:hypothetical protein